MNDSIRDVFFCPSCSLSLKKLDDSLKCIQCDINYPILNNIPRFVCSGLHDNFYLQWKTFFDVQLDSRNNTTCSRDRLIDQSGLTADDFRNKRILEVGCGAGRFTEVLLNFGANVVAIDYSKAIDICANSNEHLRKQGKLVNAQADVFNLPFMPESFNIVVGYGMLQHTGNPRLALHSLWKQVRPGGVLLVDRYQLSLRGANPFKYAIRPLLKRMPNLFVLRMAEKTCKLLVPAERFLLRRLHGNGIKKYIRYAINRFLNSTYPINLEITGKLNSDTAFKWSVLDTFDMWAPKYDNPQTFSAWRRDLRALKGGRVVTCKSAGQGNIGVIIKAA